MDRRNKEKRGNKDMDIAQIINQRYPMRLFLPGIRQVRGINLTFSPETGRDFCKGLSTFASDLNIDLSSEDYPGERVNIYFSCDDRTQSMRIRCDGAINKTFYLEDANPIPAAAWTLYAIATGKNWFEAKEAYTITLQMFSLDQQLLASSLLDALKNHRTASLATKAINHIGRTMQSDIQDLADHFAGNAPSLRFSLLSETGWHSVKRSWSGNMTYRNLLRQLGCSTDIGDEMDAYCALVRNDPEYQKKIDGLVGKMMNLLRFQPMVGIEDALKTVCGILDKRLATQCNNAASDLHTALNDPCSSRMLSAKRFAAIFGELDNVTLALASAKLRVMIFKDYAEALMERYYALYKSAIRIINGMKRSKVSYLRNCPIPPQQLNWQNLDDAAAGNSFKIVSQNWSDNGGSMLADVVQNGYPIPLGYTPLWLCGEDTYPTLKNLVYDSAQRIDGLDDQLLIAYMMKGLDR